MLYGEQSQSKKERVVLRKKKRKPSFWSEEEKIEFEIIEKKLGQPLQESQKAWEKELAKPECKLFNKDFQQCKQYYYRKSKDYRALAAQRNEHEQDRKKARTQMFDFGSPVQLLMSQGMPTPHMFLPMMMPGVPPRMPPRDPFLPPPALHPTLPLANVFAPTPGAFSLPAMPPARHFEDNVPIGAAGGEPCAPQKSISASDSMPSASSLAKMHFRSMPCASANVPEQPSVDCAYVSPLAVNSSPSAGSMTASKMEESGSKQDSWLVK